jgi:outer membrane lipoprotein SlyB
MFADRDRRRNFMKKALFGLAKSEDQATSIVDQLKVAGFSGGDISVLFPDKMAARHFAHEQHTKAPEGAAVGGASGILLGAAFGWLMGVGTLALPELGFLVAVGPIIAALACAGAGAVMGGVMGAAIGMKMPEFEALQYQDRMSGGNILLSVHTADGTERRRAMEILQNAGAVTAAEAVVEHAHGKPSLSPPLA